MSETATPPSTGPKLYLDDLQAGQRHVTGTHTLDAPGIKAFAAQFDPQPFHLDEEAADRSFFGGLAASGWHTAAVTMRLMVDGLPIAGGVIGAGADITWPAPTRPGDILQAHCEILEVKPSRSRPDRGMITMRTETRNQRGEVVQLMTTRVVVFRRPSEG
ncbi:MaoC family dehydratase [Nitrospirillum amazonense]|uniref:Acyl dehydratase n=1 Tax=Nitrospirillum amazonense TaxID=28077 RepID=A0A560K3R5_9PROT|nr:MaoC family dehydratase [Nitrospirillum amazonense]MDG3444084.1 MaoC family dehydratase [Nitrospirillum amazonense]TWB77639.1 acyl dehydratase [Nitrospirillum amazonense]